MEKDYKYKVCTCCVTYNHALFIKDALQGFNMQETSFPVVYVIIDDASTDGEQDVLRSWAIDNLIKKEELAFLKEESYGELIEARSKTNANAIFVILLLKENHYQKGREREKYEYIKRWTKNAKYQAVCEGDDYWIDSLKLKKQVEALDSHPELDICACQAATIHNGKEIGRFPLFKGDFIIPFEEVLLGGGGFVATNSLMYRTEIFERNSRSYYQLYYFDYLLQIDGSIRGGLCYLSDCMAAYRFMVKGSWSEKNINKNSIGSYNHKRKLVAILSLLNFDTDFRYADSVNRITDKLIFNMFRNGLHSGVFYDTLKNMKLRNRIKLLLSLLTKILFVK